MSQLLDLEEFEVSDRAASFPAGATAGGASSALTEAQRSMAYEQGYKAGWDDAEQAAKDDLAKISAEFSHNLLDLGFTFHEARSHVIKSLEPLLVALVENLLPELVSQTLGQRILEEIMPLAESAADTPVQVLVASENLAMLEPLLSQATFPIELAEEPSLAHGQVFLRSGKAEKVVDLNQALLAITEAISALQQSNQKAFAHGR